MGKGIGSSRRWGFTLLEMVIVLAILAVLSTLAVVSLSGVEDQSRFEQTQSELRAIEEGVLGGTREVGGGSPAYVSGFVADMGRLPLAVGTDRAMQLQELWANPRGLQPFAIRAAPSDPEVMLGTGWRGDYLRLGVGATSLKDGWGNPFDLLAADGTTPVAQDGPVLAVRSRGADNTIDLSPTVGYDADLRLAFGGTLSAAGERYIGNVGGRVQEYDAGAGQLTDPDPVNGDVTVRLFLPDPTSGQVMEKVVTIAAPFTVANYSFSAVPIGPRVIRAYQGSMKSMPMRLLVQPGGQMQDLVLR